MVDRYRIWPEGFAAHVRPTKPVDMVFADEHDAKIAALKAENERLEIAKRAIALLAAMRTAFKELEQLVPGSFDSETWAVAFKAQAWPRSGKYKRMADLSETDVHEAQQRGVGAVAKL